MDKQKTTIERTIGDTTPAPAYRMATQAALNSGFVVNDQDVRSILGVMYGPYFERPEVVERLDSMVVTVAEAVRVAGSGEVVVTTGEWHDTQCVLFEALTATGRVLS